MKHFQKLNSKGFSHLLVPLVAIVVIGGIGTYLLTASHADTLGNPLSSKAICQGAHYNRTWTGGTCSKACQTGYTPVTANPYDYCKKKAAEAITANTLCGSGYTTLYWAPMLSNYENFGYTGTKGPASFYLLKNAKLHKYCAVSLALNAAYTSKTTQTYIDIGILVHRNGGPYVDTVSRHSDTGTGYAGPVYVSTANLGSGKYNLFAAGKTFYQKWYYKRYDFDFTK
jgi:hypothetical protein